MFFIFCFLIEQCWFLKGCQLYMCENVCYDMSTKLHDRLLPTMKTFISAVIMHHFKYPKKAGQILIINLRTVSETSCNLFFSTKVVFETSFHVFKHLQRSFKKNFFVSKEHCWFSKLFVVSSRVRLATGSSKNAQHINHFIHTLCWFAKAVNCAKMLGASAALKRFAGRNAVAAASASAMADAPEERRRLKWPRGWNRLWGILISS